MKTRAILLFATFLLLSGVAASAHAEPATPTGTWQGVITGREMATSGGGTAQNARLVIREDGTWALTTATWQASGTVVTRGDRLVLDGRFVTANPGKPLGPAVYYLSPLGNQGLGGSGTADYLGVHVTTGVQLKKVQ